MGQKANEIETKPSWNIAQGSRGQACWPRVSLTARPPQSQPWPPSSNPVGEGSPSGPSILSGAVRRVFSSPCLHYFNHSVDSFTSSLDSGPRCCKKSGLPVTSLPSIIPIAPSTCHGPFYRVLFEASLELTSAVSGAGPPWALIG